MLTGLVSTLQKELKKGKQTESNQDTIILDTPAPAPAPDPAPAPSQSKNLEAQRKTTNRPKHQQTKPTYTNIARDLDPNSNKD